MNDRIRIKLLIERLKMFLSENTYTYIQDNFGYHFNGYIKKIDDVKIIFNDDGLGEIPISIDGIFKLTYSNKSKDKKYGC